MSYPQYRFHLWFLIEFGCLLVIYLHLGDCNRWMLAILGVFVAIFGVMEFTIAGPCDPPKVMHNLDCAFIAGLSLRWFVLRLLREPVPDLAKTVAFWFASAQLNFFAGSFSFCLVLGYRIAHGREDMDRTWIFHSILTLLLYLGYTIVILCKEKPPRGSSHSSGSAA